MTCSIRHLRRQVCVTAAVACILASLPATLRGKAPRFEGPAIVPKERIVLFNGRDLSGFYTWLRNHRFDDPNKVFSVVPNIDGAPAIRISGEDYGGLITKEGYANYHLVAEYRWGLLVWPPRMQRGRDSGVLVHCQPPEGNANPDFNSPWMHSIEYQIIEGATGDFIRVRGYSADGQVHMPAFTATVRMTYNGRFCWDPQGEARRFDAGGRVHWSWRDPDLKDVLGFRGPRDVEKPVGEWNRIEIICQGGSITNILNGEVVNRATEATLREGKILFQSEAAEIYFRRIELYPLLDTDTGGAKGAASPATP